MEPMKPEPELEHAAPPIHEPEYLTREETAELLRVKPWKVDQLRKAGALPFCKLGREFVYRRESINDSMKRFEGYDLSTTGKIKIAVACVQFEETHPKGKKEKEKNEKN